MNTVRPLLRGLLLAAALGALAPVPARAEWYLPRVEFGAGVADATPLADFVRFQTAPPPGQAEERRMEYATSSQFRVRVAFDLHPELQFGWTRSWRSTDLIFAIDGTELETGDVNPRTDQEIAVPEFDVTTDILAFRWWPRGVRWNGIGPTVSLGMGRISQDQKGDFAPDNLIRTFDWSGDDVAILAGVGLEGAWSRVRGGLFLDAVRWRYEAPDEDTAGNPRGDVAIPIETVVSVEFGARLSVGF